ncbi:hypothetical protein PL321_07070 [Caloramator sp. mosi_1]|uniref:hypothetical protein n=1 Tax=Caloramator sp. mosi_1 TaxID=3023090 RepID=UPI00235F3705|nr:hypothetical protein [Caloramator sp. mosi_1]WDC85216.1 hypothetical protein PL321_07070 [Caloramator sp. mosi_1]
MKLGLNEKYKINYVTIKEVRPAITNIMIRALEQYMEETGRNLFCYFNNHIIYVGKKLILI